MSEPTVAYFSMEIGLQADVPTYSGGLGVLAGDMIRADAHANIPKVGVSLLHRRGYLRQMRLPRYSVRHLQNIFAEVPKIGVASCTWSKSRGGLSSLPQQTVRTGEMGNGRSGRSGVQDVGDGVEGFDEPFLFRGAEADGVPSVHFAGVEQRTADGGFRNEPLHPGGEDFGDLSVLLGIEDILHSPRIDGMVPVEDGPDESTQVLAAVAVGGVANTGGQVLQGLLGRALMADPQVQFSLGEERGRGEDGGQKVADGFGLRVFEFRPPCLGAVAWDCEEHTSVEADSGATIGEGRRCGAFKAPASRNSLSHGCSVRGGRAISGAIHPIYHGSATSRKW